MKKQVTVKLGRHNKWKIKSSWSTKCHRIVEDKTTAFSIGRRIAMNHRCELIIYREDNTIRSKDTFPPTSIRLKDNWRTSPGHIKDLLDNNV